MNQHGMRGLPRSESPWELETSSTGLDLQKCFEVSSVKITLKMEAGSAQEAFEPEFLTC